MSLPKQTVGDLYPSIIVDQCVSVKPCLHQIYVARYKHPGRATCIRLHVDGYKFSAVFYSRTQVDTLCSRDDNLVADTVYM